MGKARAKILVVDDEPSFLKLVSHLLIAEGHEVDTAVNGIDALDKIRGKEYHLLLTGIRMPGMTGFEFYERVRKIAPSLANKTIVISGSIDSADTKEFLTKYKLPYFAKPFIPKQLVSVVNVVLDSERIMAKDEVNHKYTRWGTWQGWLVIITFLGVFIGFLGLVKVSEEVPLSYEVTFSSATNIFLLSNTDEVPGTFTVVFNYWAHGDIREGYLRKVVLYLEPGQAEVIEAKTDKLNSYPAITTIDGRLSHYYTDFQVTPDTKIVTKRVSLFEYLLSKP